MNQPVPHPEALWERFEAYNAVQAELDQVEALGLAIGATLSAEVQLPQDGRILPALIKAQSRAVDDAKAMLEAHYHPCAENELQG